MKRLILLVVLGVLSSVGPARADQTADSTPSALLKQGRYLVERVGNCADCHTPRDRDGSYDMKHWLLGAPLTFAPTVPMPVWASVAPPIAGLKGFTDAQALRVLERGINTNGKPLRPPMPPFRFDPQDARAVLAYLRSLPSSAPSGAH